jgi:hypothetical protein
VSVAFDFNGMHFDEGLRVFASSREAESGGHAKTRRRAQRNAEHLTIYFPSAPLCVLCGYIPCLVTVCPMSRVVPA